MSRSQQMFLVSLLLGLVSIFNGSLKVSGTIDNYLHMEMRREFVKFARVFPLAQALGFKIKYEKYLEFVGLLEIVCGALLAFFPNFQVKRTSNVVLLLLAILIVYSHFLVEEKSIMHTITALMSVLTLGGRLWLEFQNEPRRTRQQEELHKE